MDYHIEEGTSRGRVDLLGCRQRADVAERALALQRLANIHRQLAGSNFANPARFAEAALQILQVRSDGRRFFREHFVKKGTEVARACLDTVSCLQALPRQGG